MLSRGVRYDDNMLYFTVLALERCSIKLTLDNITISVVGKVSDVCCDSAMKICHSRILYYSAIVLVRVNISVVGK